MTTASPLRNLASELRADVVSATAVPALSAGFTTGLGLLVAQIAYGSLIFSGMLAPYASQGVGLVLFGNFAACLVIALAGGFRGAISGLSPALVIVMAQIGATMDAEGEGLFVTTATALMIGAVATGLCFLLIGRYRLANQDLDWNREFSATGLASVVAGLGGGTAASMIVPASLRSRLFGAASRLTGVVAALVIAAALFLGDGMLELVPVPLVGGMLFFAGAGMLDEGLVKSRKRLPRSEYGIILLIVGIITAFGLFHGVAAGMLAALVFFAVRLSRVDPIQARFTARERRSTKARPVPDRAILREEGERVLAYRLRGYIFFGSVCPLADHLRKCLSGDSRPTCLMLDFAAVSGFDFSAVTVLARFLQSANATGVQVVLSAPSEQLKSLLERNLPPSDLAAVRVEPDADRALERCEEMVIQAWNENASLVGDRRASLLERAVDDLERHLERQIRFEDLMDELGNWLTPCRYAAGEALAGPGAPSQGLQLLTSGRASAQEAAGRRSRQFGPGDAIWPADPSDGKAPAVIADQPCETMLLAPDARRWLEDNEESLALKLYRYLLARRFEAEPNASRPE